MTDCVCRRVPQCDNEAETRPSGNVSVYWLICGLNVCHCVVTQKDENVELVEVEKIIGSCIQKELMCELKG